MSYINYPVTFDGANLEIVPGLTVLSTNPYIPAKRKLSIESLARSNKSKITGAFYDKRTITVRVGIAQPTRALVETALDTLMGLLQGQDKILILQQSGGLRKYTSTLADVVIERGGGSYLEMDLVFETSDHFGYDINPTLLLQVTNFTSYQKTDQITVGGSADWQAPVITITWSAISGGTSASVSVGNGETGQTITVTRTYTAGDVLEVDSLNQTVKVNGIEVSFSGAFPEWAPGIGYLTYLDTFTARTFSNTTRHYRRWV